MSIQRQVFNKIIKVVKVLLKVFAIIIVLFMLFVNSFDSENKVKSKNFSEKDYKIISSVFEIDEGTFEIKDIIYCPYIDSGNRWYVQGGNNELYNIKLFMDYDDISLLEKNYNIEYLNGDYSGGFVKSKFSNDVGVHLYLRCDYENPDLCMVMLNYHGHNDELDDILPIFSSKLKIFVALSTLLFVLIWTCFRDIRKSRSQKFSEQTTENLK